MRYTLFVALAALLVIVAVGQTPAPTSPAETTTTTAMTTTQVVSSTTVIPPPQSTTPSPTTTPPPTEPTGPPGPPPDKSFTEGEKFGISTATFACAAVLWNTICFFMSQYYKRRAPRDGPPPLDFFAGTF
jgi:hypothetical protein